MHFVFARFLLFLFLHTKFEARRKTLLLHSICTQRTFTYLPSLFKQKNCYGQLTFLSQYFIWPLSLKHHHSTQLYCKPTKKRNKKYSKLNRPCISVQFFSTILFCTKFLCRSFPLSFIFISNSSRFSISISP